MKHGDTHDPEEGLALERVIFFSDAVFAIAITLLVLEIRLPELGEGVTLTDALLSVLPRVGSYVISFTVIGSSWVSHHYDFRRIKRFDYRLVWINLLLLMLVAFLPFPTSVQGEYGSRPAAGILYAVTVALIGLVRALLWWYASHDRRLVDRKLTAGEIHYIQLRTLLVPIVFLLSIPLAWAGPYVIQYSWSSLFVFGRLLRWRYRNAPWFSATRH